MMNTNSFSPSYAMLLSLVPKQPHWKINWDEIWALSPAFPKLDECPQDSIYHAEGDVGTHTRMVVEALVSDPQWRRLDDDDRAMLFWTACFHDIGKPATTLHEEDGRITSRGHSRVGAAIARELLWYAEAPFDWREKICGLIASHQLPFWLIERPDPARLAIETSWQCRPDFLCLHATADAIGRICEDQRQILENVELARATFEEVDCLKKPFEFANDESRIAFIEKEDRDPYYKAHEDFRCEVTVMSALPGTGKDTWISNHLQDLPVVSMDEIREEIGIKPTANQGKVIQATYERAKEHLRDKQDFVWNATNVTKLTRGKVLRLLRDYNARIHIVYLEVSPATLLKQNKNRSRSVPDSVIHNLARKLEPPTLLEGHRVSYVT